MSTNEEDDKPSPPGTPAIGANSAATGTIPPAASASGATPPSPTPFDTAKAILAQDPALVIIQLGDDFETIQQLREYGQQLTVYADASLKQLGKMQRGSKQRQLAAFLGKRKSSGGEEEKPNPNKRKHKANWKLIQECKDKVEEDQDISSFRNYVDQLHEEFAKLNTSNTPENGCCGEFLVCQDSSIIYLVPSFY